MQIFHPRLLLAVALAAAVPAHAFHRETPAAVALTTDGDTDLPRVPSQGRRSLALSTPGGVVSLLPFKAGPTATPVAAAGLEPAVAYNGRSMAWQEDGDPLGRGLFGWQIVVKKDKSTDIPLADPSGTSRNPSLDKRASVLAFESAGDLTDAGLNGVYRVYVLDKNGVLTLASRGNGDSGRAMVSAKGKVIAFESTSHLVTGADTGIAQIWVGRLTSLPADPITAGAGPSTAPVVSDDGRLIVFTSTAALAGDGHDTGTSQVFAYDVPTATFAQITDEPAGCTRPAVAKVRRDWRITFVCGGEAYYHMLRENRRYHVPTPGGSTQSIIPEMGVHFLILSTTADLVGGGGSTSGHRIYLRNVFAEPAEPAAGSAVWFPEQGIPGF
jgi:hypothetical protein